MEKEASEEEESGASEEEERKTREQKRKEEARSEAPATRNRGGERTRKLSCRKRSLNLTLCVTDPRDLKTAVTALLS